MRAAPRRKRRQRDVEQTFGVQSSAAQPPRFHTSHRLRIKSTFGGAVGGDNDGEGERAVAGADAPDDAGEAAGEAEPEARRGADTEGAIAFVDVVMALGMGTSVDPVLGGGGGGMSRSAPVPGTIGDVPDPILVVATPGWDVLGVDDVAPGPAFVGLATAATSTPPTDIVSTAAAQSSQAGNERFGRMTGVGRARRARSAEIAFARPTGFARALSRW
jgi:hypothetical protein